MSFSSEMRTPVIRKLLILGNNISVSVQPSNILVRFTKHKPEPDNNQMQLSLNMIFFLESDTCATNESMTNAE